MHVPEPQLNIRSARRNDLPGLAPIWSELMEMHERADPHFALAQDGLARWRMLAEDMLERDDAFLFIADLDNQPVGFCLGWIARNPPIYEVSEVGFISEIAVRRAAQRSGVGSALVAAARRWFARHGLREFQLSTAVWNEDAQEFWKAVGGEPLLVRYRFSVDT